MDQMSFILWISRGRVQFVYFLERDMMVRLSEFNLQKNTRHLAIRIDTTGHRLIYFRHDVVLDLLNHLIHLVIHLLLLVAPHLVAVALHFLFGPTSRLITPLLVVSLNTSFSLFTLFESLSSPSHLRLLRFELSEKPSR